MSIAPHTPPRPLPTSLRPDSETQWGIPHAVAAYITGLVLGNLLYTAAGGDPSASTTTVAIHLASVSGLWIGFIAGLTMAAILLNWRFAVMLRRLSAQV